MTDRQKQWLLRILLGGGAGVLPALALWGPLFAGGYSAPPVCRGLMDVLGLPGAAAVTLGLCFGFGAAVGVATLPFEDQGGRVLRRSLLHFAVTACLFSALLTLSLGMEPRWLPLWLLLLAAVYLVIWLGRWVGWYVEVAAIRSKLGLAPGPSLLHWRETLPYLVFALGLCLGLPALLRLLDPQDVPVLSGVYFPFLLLPIGTFCSGLSLGHRHGFSPLYPVACALLSVAAALLLFNGSALFHGGISLVCALVGNGVGTLLKKRAPREKNP